MMLFAGGFTEGSVAPPVVNTVPSGNIVRLCNTLEKCIGVVGRQVGLLAVISSTDVAALGYPEPSSQLPPMRTTFPGRYMAERPSAGVAESTIVQDCVLMSSIRLLMATLVALAI